MSVIIRDACISDAPRLLEIYSYYVQHTAISFEYTTPTQEEFCRRMRHIMSRYPYLVAEVDGTVQGGHTNGKDAAYKSLLADLKK